MEGLEPAGALRTFMSEEPAITARTRSYAAAWAFAIVRELRRKCCNGAARVKTLA